MPSEAPAPAVEKVPENMKARHQKPPLGPLFWPAMVWLGLVVFCAVFAGLLPLPDPNRIVITDQLKPIFSDGHILGTDALGRDMLSRLAHGARISVVISVTAVAVGLIVGGILGTMVGYYGGLVERTTMGIVNVILAFPSLILLLGVVAMVGSSLTSLTSVFAFLAIPGYLRFARGSTLALKQQEFVLAAKTLGARDGRVILRSLLPNVMVTLVTFGLLALGGIVVAEGTLAFLGLGLPAPQATWGGMIAEGRAELRRSQTAVLVPATVMFLTVLSINLVGDGLRRRLDVREVRI